MPKVFYIVTNPISGGAKGNDLIKIAVPGGLHLLDAALDLDVNVHIFDIREGASGSKPAFLSLKKHVEEAEAGCLPIPIVVAGGDGTVLWAMSEIADHGISPESVAVGVLPFGTGNDFSRATKWGGSVPLSVVGKDLKHLKRLIKGYLGGVTKGFDLWDVEVSLKENGGIYQIKGGKKTLISDNSSELSKSDINPEGYKTPESEDDKQRTVVLSPKNTKNIALTRKCCNYFSLGVEARVGQGFARHRTKSVICNKMVYGCEGTKKMFMNTGRIRDWLSHVEINGNPVDLSVSDPASLVFLNIPSISGGVDFWNVAKPVPVFASQEEGEARFPAGSATPQTFFDHKMEVITVPSLFSFARSLLSAKGAATKQAQAAGPFSLVFRDNIHEQRVYFQVDGEFFQVQGPHSINIKWARSVQVLVNEKPSTP